MVCEQSHVSGRLRVFAFDAERRWLLCDTPNLLLDAGLDALAALFGGAYGSPVVGGTTYLNGGANPPSDLYIDTMQVTDAASPSEPAAGDSSLDAAAVLTFAAGGATLTTEYPSTGQVRFSGSIQPVDSNGTVFSEEGLLTADGTLVARAMIAKAATGTVRFTSGDQPADGDTLKVHDGSTGVIFEFEGGGGVTGGNTAVTIGSTVTETRDNLIAAINTSGLNVTPTAMTDTVPAVEIVNATRQAAGNVPLTVTGSVLAVTGMSEGRDAITKESAFGLTFEHTITVGRA